jgi:hypothetical protein
VALQPKHIVRTAVVVAIAAAIVVTAFFFGNPDRYRGVLEAQASSALGRKVQIGKLSVSLLAGGVAADQVTIADDPAFSRRPFLTAHSVDIGVKLLPLLLHHELQITSFTIHNPEVQLLQNAAGVWNYSTLGETAARAAQAVTLAPAGASVPSHSRIVTALPPPGPDAFNSGGRIASPRNAAKRTDSARRNDALSRARPSVAPVALRSAAAVATSSAPISSPAMAPIPSPPSPAPNAAAPSWSIDALSVKNATLLVGTIMPPSHLRAYTNVNVSARDISQTRAFPFSFDGDTPGKGTLKFDGQAGPLATPAANTPLRGNFSAGHLGLVANGFTDASSGLDALVNANGLAVWNGRQATVNGKGNLQHLRLVAGAAPAQKPMDITFTTDYDSASQSGRILNAVLQTGRAAASVSGSYSLQSQPATLHLQINGSRMPVGDVAALLPAAGLSLPAGASLGGGTLNLSLAIAGPTDCLATSGNVALADTRVNNFDLGARLSSLATLAGMRTGSALQIQRLSSAVLMNPAGTRLNSIELIAPQVGTLTGSGIIQGNGALDFHMQLRLNRQSPAVGAIYSIAGIGNNPAIIPFVVRGTASNPVFAPDVNRLVGSGAKGNPGQALKGLLNNLNIPH